jgi:chromosome segregation ATPase
MIDTADIQQQVDALSREVDAAVREAEARLGTAQAELSQIASEIENKKEKIAEIERNPLPEIPEAIAQTEPSAEAYRGAELSPPIAPVIAVAEQIFRQRSAATGKELQWFYVRDTQRMGPVNQSQLLDLLEQGELQWNVLVWNKKLSDWIKASESELIDFSDGPPPPPIPSTTPAAKNQPGKEQKCKACGRVNGPDDRFCAGCGKPLRSTRK